MAANISRQAVQLVTNKIQPASRVLCASLHTSGSRKSDEPVIKKNLINHSRVRGIDILRNPKLNKGTSFTLKERQLMGIHGLLPPVVRSESEQLIRVMANFENRQNDLDRYIYLSSLQDRNERLFYRVLTEHVEAMMPIVYTPTVGLACQQYGVAFRRPRGLFISIKDAGHIYEIICNWPERNVKAIVVTDGERILGLGDLGVYGMGIPVGKLSLYTALGGIDPSKCLPICLDVGTNNEALHTDPLYIGHAHHRVTGQAYDDFIDEFMRAVAKRYGHGCLVQFEDFANKNAFRLLEKYRNQYCTFNDDIQGTASVAAAGVFASLRITKKKLKENTFVFLGAGEASIGIAELLALAMREEGLSKEEAYKRIWLIDSKGLIVKDRSTGGINHHKEPFAKPHKELKDLEDIVNHIKPTALIGAAAMPQTFTTGVLKAMATHNERPIIFALSNPTSMAECTAEQAYNVTEGRCVFASGSPFPPCTVNGQTFIPGQGNNAYIFPGVALGVLTCGVRHIEDRIFLHAAQALAGLVTDEHLAEGRIYPPMSGIQEISLAIAVDLAQYVYKEGMALHYPEPEDKEAFIKSFLYDTAYESFEPETWEWDSDQ